MKTRLLQTFIQGLIISLFFLKIFNYYVGEDKFLVTGFEAIITNRYYYIGNIMILVILLSAITQFILLLISFINYGLYKKKEDLFVTIVNIELVIGLLMVTFLGINLEWLGLALILLIIISAVIKHKFKT